MKKLKYILCSLMLLTALSVLSQETLADDPNAFLVGGDQGENSATLNLLPIAIIDVEPDPNNALIFGGVSANLEAGLPILSGALNGINEELWLNFTHREDNLQSKVIYVRSNLPLPQEMTITIQIITTLSSQGNYTENPNPLPITLTNSNQIIVNAFGSGYTGNGVGHGYQLRYTIDNPRGVALPSGFEVIYTIE